MRKVYQVASLVCIAFGAFVVWQSRAMTLYNEMGPGAGFFPFWLGIVFVGLSALWLGQVSLQTQLPKREGFVPDRAGVLRMLSIVGAMVVFVTLAGTIGFQLCMFAFLLFLFVALGRQSWMVTLLVSIAGSFGVYYVFDTWLAIELPRASIELLANLGL